MILPFCLLVNSACFFCCLLLFFFNINVSKTSFKNTNRVSNGLDPDQARHFVGPGLDPNCLQRLSAYDISRQKANELFSLYELQSIINMDTSCEHETMLIPIIWLLTNIYTVLKRGYRVLKNYAHRVLIRLNTVK